MHTNTTHTTARVVTLVGRAVAAVLACALLGTLMSPTAVNASDIGDSGVRVVKEPALADGYRGWTTRVTTVRIIPTRPGRIYYTWDCPLGGWKPYEGELIVPEGKRTLHAALVDESTGYTQVWTGEIKVDYKSPVRTVGPTLIPAAYVGSTAQVSVSVSINPWTGTRIIRLGGRDRYETSALISAENFPTADTVIIATGQNFADALASSGLAGCEQAPVLLTKRTSLPGTVAAEISRLGASRAIIVGGTAAVGSAVQSQVAALGLDVDRIGGADRYETAALIGFRVMSFGSPNDIVFIARGDDFADALSLGPLAYASKAPLLLVKPNSVPPATRSFLGANPISSGCIAGGTVAVSDGVAAELGGYVVGLQRVAGSTRYSTATAIATWAEASGLADFATVGLATGTDFADALCGGIAMGANGGIVLLTRPGDLPGATSDWVGTNVGDLRDMQVFGGEAAILPGVVEDITQMTR